MEVLKQLYNEARMGQDEIPAHRQIVGIAVDEIYIKSDLVYDRHSARGIGFVNLGAVGEQLEALEQSSFPAIATRALTVMVRGIFYRLNFPLANFLTAGVTSVNLLGILWQAFELLERCVFTVVFETADISSPNRSYFRCIKILPQHLKWLTRLSIHTVQEAERQSLSLLTHPT